MICFIVGFIVGALVGGAAVAWMIAARVLNAQAADERLLEWKE